MKIRIGVLVNEKGEWLAMGSDNADDAGTREDLNNCCNWSDSLRERLYFIEAEIELPSVDPVVVVQGTVTP